MNKHAGNIWESRALRNQENKRGPRGWCSRLAHTSALLERTIQGKDLCVDFFLLLYSCHALLERVFFGGSSILNDLLA